MYYPELDNSPENMINPKRKTKNGFTLIELSIVLVVIGLIIGGILVGQNLINAAAVRAQITQIEKFQTAARTFQGKYGYLPGDIPDPYATRFGFVSRTNVIAGQGDGNGIVGGWNDGCCNQSMGEIPMFWVDLSTAHLIEGSFSTATPATTPSADVPQTGVGNYLPQAKIGQGNYIYVWAGGFYNASISNWQMTGINYYGISAVTSILASSNYGWPVSTPGLTAAQASAIDKKIDDGLPEYGNVVALYATNNYVYWSDGTAASLQTPQYSPDTNSINPSTTTCYDNAGSSASVKNYTTAVNSSNLNCALSFKFQ